MFRFSIRELLLVVALVAVSAGWWVDRWQLSRLCADAAANAESAAKVAAVFEAIAENERITVIRKQNSSARTP